MVLEDVNEEVVENVSENESDEGSDIGVNTVANDGNEDVMEWVEMERVGRNVSNVDKEEGE
jgi:hypothetical protein